jgi:hypothetical protein
MTSLLSRRCLHHPDREAVARCPECGRFFCRECITEHEDRIICASCLTALTDRAAKPERSSRLPSLFRILRAGSGLFVAWLFFYMLGHYLLTFPSDFHSDLWKNILTQTDEDD